MSDYKSKVMVKTETDGDVVAKIVDSAGSNVMAVDTNGSLQANLVNTAGNPIEQWTVSLTNTAGSGVPVTPATSAVFDIAIGGQAPQLDDTDKLAVSIYGTNGANPAGEKPLQCHTDGYLYSLITDGTSDIGLTVNGEVKIAVGSQTPQMDDTSKLAVSIYGKNSAAGDMSIGCGAAGNAYTTIMDIDGTYDAKPNSDGSLAVFGTFGKGGTMKTSGQLSSTNLAAAATANLDTAAIVSGRVGKLFKIVASAHGVVKCELQHDDAIAETFVTKFTFFLSSTQPTIIIDFKHPEEVMITGNDVKKYRLKVTNLDNVALDVYATIDYLET